MNPPFNYPVQLAFKILALAPQIAIRDANGNLLGYVRQKLLALKEAVTVYSDEAQTQPVFTMKADRIIDFSARYHFTRVADGANIGSVKQHGARSLWSLHLEIADESGAAALSIREENPWIKMADALLGELPVIGMFTGYFFNPVYLIKDEHGTVLLRVVKRKAFLESRFEVNKVGEISPADEQRATLALVMMLLLHRGRG